MFLRGVRVLDLSQYLPGPYAALMLADLGADVVKIEPPGGDPGRGLPPLDADGVSPLWKRVNAGKTVVTLDLKAAADEFTRLVERADVLIESYRPGVLDRLGFGRDRLAALNPRLIHAALSGYGQTGPWRSRTGHDLNYMATAGILAASGSVDRPMMAFPPVADYASGMQTALAICAALASRATSGRGAYLDLSLTETVLAWQGPWLDTKPERARAMLNGGAAYYQIYATADRRFVTLAAIEPKFWANFCAAIGRPEWTARQDEPLAQFALIADVAALLSTRTAAEWEALLGPIDCCFAVVLDHAEVAAHPQHRARDVVNRFPAWIDGAPSAARPAVSRAGAAAILARWS